ncbi:hypothetical protein [Gottfriedia acidiceleris]|uniref:hypothetical protein n=1 Tax=Gottfriedia acidiceleris TaxID=371036 RepID=UPI003000B017
MKNLYFFIAVVVIVFSLIFIFRIINERNKKLELVKQEFLKGLVDDIIVQMKEGTTGQYLDYKYLDGKFLKDSQVVEEEEVRDSIYQFWKSGAFSLYSTEIRVE